MIGTNTDQETIARMSLADPFGRIAFGDDHALLDGIRPQHAGAGVTGALLMNRLIWLSVAVVALVVAAYRFQFHTANGSGAAARVASSRSALPDLDRTDASDAGIRCNARRETVPVAGPHGSARRAEESIRSTCC